MADPRLPAALAAALDGLAGGDMAGRAAAQSDAYRAMTPSRAVVHNADDVAAYLAVRMPATYAAALTVLEEARSRLPGFTPRTLLDAGAGPGTASWAAVEAFASLAAVTLLDHNRGFLELAGRLAATSPAAALAGAARVLGSIPSRPSGAERFDLVVAGYALTELPDAEVVAAALGLWGRCSGALVLIEPGRTRDYQRLMAIRTALFAAGAGIVAPCPHQQACPLPAGDWCHFSVRLPRRRAHRQAKGATLGYEDEKFSYLVVARPELVARPVAARVIRGPVQSKFAVEVPLCARDGLETRVAARRAGAEFKLARKLAWGDGLDESGAVG